MLKLLTLLVEKELVLTDEAIIFISIHFNNFFYEIDLTLDYLVVNIRYVLKALSGFQKHKNETNFT